MLRIEDLPLHALHAARLRLGAEDEHDVSLDRRIAAMTPQQLAGAYAGWHLGDEQWAEDIIAVFTGAQEALED